MKSTQKFTGERDYYHIIYEINYITGTGGIETTHAYKKHELESEMDEIDTRYIVAIYIIVEHIVDGDIVYNDKVIIGTVEGPLYQNYKHKL